MPKINVYLPDDLAAAVKDANLPVSAICQSALEQAVRTMTAVRGTEAALDEGGRAGMLQRFTPRARTAVAQARAVAKEHGHSFVGTEHVLLGILDEGGNLAVKVLQSLDIELDDLRRELEGSMSPASKKAKGSPRFTPFAKSALAHAASEAMRFGHNYIGCEHLLLGVIAEEEGLAAQVLQRMGVELRSTRRAVTTALSGFVHAKQSLVAGGVTPTPELIDIVKRLEAIEQKLAG
jgi:ATP-dependent Clp protease ATP-binding subunit ClpA